MLNGVIALATSGKYAYASAANEDGLEIIELTGIESPAANIGSLAVNTLDIWDNANLVNNMYIGHSLGVGPGGVLSNGPLSVSASSSYINYRLGIGTTTASMHDLYLYNSFAETGVNAQLTLQSNPNQGEHWSIYHDGATDDLRFWKDGQDRVVITDDGRMGIGIMDPVRTLQISNYMILEPQDTAPADFAEGTMYIDNTSSQEAMCVRLNGSWQKVINSGSGTCD